MTGAILAVILASATSGLATPDTPTVVVDPRGPITTLTAALRQVRPGGRILVRAGTYREPMIVVDRPVEIVGADWPVFDGGGTHGILTVRADRVTIRGLELGNVGASFTEDRAAIRVEGTRQCAIDSNRISAAFFGIYLSRVGDCRVSGNMIRGSAAGQLGNANAIHLYASRDVTVEGNRVSGHRDGIYLEFARRVAVRNNRSSGNTRYGLHFMFSDSCEYRGNTFSSNGAGVAVMYTRNVTIEDNRFEQSRGPASYGLLLKDISDSRVARNQFRRNTTGILLEGSDRLDVTDNEFRGNGWALRIMADAGDDRFTGNRFEGNSFDVATGGRAEGARFSRNYWDHYAGYDLDRDGYGDVPYRPVRLFSLVVGQHEAAVILLRSFFMEFLDTAERVLPVLTPETLMDPRPLMRPPA